MLYQKCPKCGAIAYARSLITNGYYCYPSHGGCGQSFPVRIEKKLGLFWHTIPANRFLKKAVSACFHDFYVPVMAGGGVFSSLLLDIKSHATERVKEEIAAIVGKDFDIILSANRPYLENRPVVVVVPRSKPDSYWKSCQLQFRPAITIGLQNSTYAVKGSTEKWIINGTDYLIRMSPTKTTHLAHLNLPENIGPDPYPGITKDTCQLNGDVYGKNVILVDDIYTEGKGIDEDCIQFLFNRGVKNIILYTLGMTKKKNSIC